MLAKFLRKIIERLNNLYLKLLEDGGSQPGRQFKGLSPYIEKDSTIHANDIYAKALSEALYDRNIKNIAVAGAFGAGKSSFLRTFEYHNNQWNYLFISLATFKDKKGDENNQLIERSILQQLFYKVKKESIPLTRFVKLQRVSSVKVFWQWVLFLSWLSSLIYFYKTDLLYKVLHQIDSEIKINLLGQHWNLVVALIFLFSSAILSWKLYSYLSNFRITKLSLDGGIDVSEESKKSVLNNYIDEILYFFEMTKYNVVVIEDLDRANNQEIYIKLREINELINKSEQIKIPVNFVYAIKDDMFDDDARTKFFEFIIPIVPYINQSNSYVMLCDELTTFTGSKSDTEFKKLLKIISQYIEDMRLLVNVVNEFRVYSEKVTHINISKLFAVLVYKNVMPADFAKLHKGKGILATIFNNKSNYVEVVSTKLDDEISALENKISDLESKGYWINNIKELRALYVYYVIRRLGRNDLFIDSEQVDFSEDLSREQFDKMRSAKSISTNPRYSGITFAEIEDLVGGASYGQRLAFIRGEVDQTIQSWKEEIEELERNKFKLKTLKLNELLEFAVVDDEIKKDMQNASLQKTDSEKEPDEDSFKNQKQLIRYLIRLGYIDENYHTYISYFHEGEFSQQDNQFLLSVRDQQSLSSTYALSKPDEVLGELEFRDFQSPYILNLSLIESLVFTNLHTDKRKVFFEWLAKDQTLIKFIVEYYDAMDSSRDMFIYYLVESDSLFWQKISRHSGLTLRQKSYYLASILRTHDLDTVMQLDREGCLKDFIKFKSDFIPFCIQQEMEPDKIQTLLLMLNIRFQSLEWVNSDNPYSELIYKNSFYELNREIIFSIWELFFKEYLTPEIKEGLTFKNLTTIRSANHQGFEPLKNYIDENIEEYVQEVLLKSDINVDESEETVINLLNNENLAISSRIAILKKEKTKIVNVKDIDDSHLWPHLLDNNCLVSSWDNIFYVYELESEMDDVTEKRIRYLNDEENYLELAKDKMHSYAGFDDEFIKSVAREILLSDKLSDVAHSFLVKSNRWCYSNINFSGVSKNKISALLQERKIQFTIENFDYFVASESDELIAYICSFFDDYVELRRDINLPEGVLTKLLETDLLQHKNKEILIEYNFNENRDFELLAQEAGLAKAVLNTYLEGELVLEEDVFLKLLNYYDGDDTRLVVHSLIKATPELMKDEVFEALKILGSPYLNIKETGFFAFLPKEQLNYDLIDQLQAYEIIPDQSNTKDTKNKIKVTLKRK